MFSFLLPFACFFVFAYPPMRLSEWLWPGAGLSWFAVIALWLVSWAATWYAFRGPNMWVRHIMVNWIGAGFITLTFTALGEIAAIALPHARRDIALGVLAVSACVVVFAVVMAQLIFVRRITLRSDKIAAPHRIVQISDVHVGSRRAGFLRRVVKKVEAQDADSVVITGDLIDSSAVGADALASLGEIRARKFFVIGNHERYSGLEKFLAIMQSLGVETLRQESAIQGGVQFIGIDDADSQTQVAEHLTQIQLAPDAFRVLLYHRPRGFEDAANAGIDLMLCGHTHAGQIFPFDLLVRRQYAQIKGLHETAGARLYVSSGTGTWGPLMRLGSVNEVTRIDLVPR